MGNSKIEIIRWLNDRLRVEGIGGMVVLTGSLIHEHPVKQLMARSLVAAFDAFDEANDPYGEHDYGVIMLKGEKIMWKIDYYATDMMHLSPDPADPEVTKRVLSIFLSEDY